MMRDGPVNGCQSRAHRNNPAFSAAAIVAALTAIPVSTAFATTPPNDVNDVTQVDNPADDNDSGGFDDWGLLGLLGLAGLAGLKRRNDHVTTVRDDNLTSR